MKAIYVVAIAAVTAIATTALMFPLWAHSQEPIIKTVTVTVYEKEPKLSPAQIIWLARLMQCESGIKVTAINPKDLDNTPSYGLLQFKPSTFKAYAKMYGIKGELMDAEAQVAIVEQWILRAVDLKNQFPACVKKLGPPPTNTDSQR